MATLDLDLAVDRIRLNLGDTQDLEWLSDTEIQYALDSNEQNEAAATKQCAAFILARLAFDTHSKIGALEVWGSEAYAQYKSFLKDILTSSSFAATGGIYVGGMDKAEVIANMNDTTIVQKGYPSYVMDEYQDINDLARTTEYDDLY